MSRPLAPRALSGSSGTLGTTGPGGAPPNRSTPQRPRKISTACSACKQRKTRCTGGSPCEACASRDSACVYDATSDQRRKIANQRNVHDLAEAHSTLERQRQLIGGMIATVRAGNDEEIHHLLTLIRQGVDLSQLAAHVRNACRSSLEIQQVYERLDFTIDGQYRLPHADQIFNYAQPHSSGSTESRSPYSDKGGDTQGGFLPGNSHEGEKNP